MSLLSVNPFLDPRAADSLNGKDFVRCFSPYLVDHMPEVFSQGNVILSGTIGCGKSMLLRLFDPNVRIAYFEKKKPFPLPEQLCHFIGTGINLSKSGILDIVQRMPPSPTDEELHRLAAIFTDYLNFWLVDDLLESYTLMSSQSECFGELINPLRSDAFIKTLTKEDCWFGYLRNCKTLEEVRARINYRLNQLRSWANWNVDDIDKEIRESKAAVGEPIATTVVSMKQTGLLHTDAVAFVRIDQLEELLHKNPSQAQVTRQFRERIYLALGRRDGRVSYRIGTRKYDNDALAMPGGRHLEESRDFTIIDFDTILRRGETSKGWLFKGFAEDVFDRRLNASFPPDTFKASRTHSLFSQFFGTSPSPARMIESIIVNQSTPVESLLPLEKLSPAWAETVKQVYRGQTSLFKPARPSYRIDPLNAALMCAWAFQNGGKKGLPARHELEDPPTLDKKWPWTVWWRKERMRHALLQLASKHQQRLVWWGAQSVLGLSSNNITLFLSIGRETWELWQRSLRSGESLPSFTEAPIEVQQVAIDNISKRWHQNLARQPGRPGGDVRLRFIDRIFAHLRTRLRKDQAMRYPGASGFSILSEELSHHKDLKRLLDECVAWGDLERIEHTSKRTDDKVKGGRHKFYANSILVPFYQIYESHTKEPYYMDTSELLKFASEANALPRNIDITEQPELNFGND